MYVNVALPIPAPRLFTYRLEEQPVEESPLVGRRVLVPFGKRQLTGVIVEIVQQPAVEEAVIKPVLEVLDEAPIFSPSLLRFTRWMADYYFASWGEVLKAALPQGMTPETVLRVTLTRPIAEEELQQLRKRAPRRAAVLEALLRHPQGVSVRFLERTVGKGGLHTVLEVLEEMGWIRREQQLQSQAQPKRQKAVSLAPGLLEDPDQFRRVLEEVERKAPKQALLLSALYLKQLHQPDEPVFIGDLIREVGGSYAAIKALEDKGYVVEYEAEILRTTDQPTAPELAPKDEAQLPLTVEQEHAKERICEALQREEFKTFLLYGVTGSGKTLVYFHAIRTALDRGRTALCLVPEISLTPQLVERFRRAFPETVAVFHSRMSAGERYDVWQVVRRGEAKVVVGTRSAIFLPLPDLGVIIVDEEHDPSYKQVAPSPRYHARDCAVVRGSLERAVVVLGSATPSLESMYNAQTGKYHLLEIRQRVEQAQLPAIAVVDMRQAWRMKKVLGSFSTVLLEKILERIEQRQGVILLQNRRGFASWLECPECGYIPQCPHCTVALTYHKFRQQMRCHYCGYTQPVEWQCPKCGAEMRLVGRGTQRVEEELGQLLQQYGRQANIQRVDLDAVATRTKLQQVLQAFARREVDILVGTQMIAKGLDFPHVTLVGVINADVQLYLPDFRAAERTFQLLMQVAGRAGRTGDAPGEVVIQTMHPHHPVIRAVQAQSYELFYNDELQLRREAHYPPFTRFVLVEFSGKDEEKVHQAAHRMALLLPRKHRALEVLGPAVPPIARLRGYYRRFLAIKNFKDVDPTGTQLQHILSTALHQYHQKYGTPAVRHTIDVDAYGIA